MPPVMVPKTDIRDIQERVKIKKVLDFLKRKCHDKSIEDLCKSGESEDSNDSISEYSDETELHTLATSEYDEDQLGNEIYGEYINRYIPFLRHGNDFIKGNQEKPNLYLHKPSQNLEDMCRLKNLTLNHLRQLEEERATKRHEQMTKSQKQAKVSKARAKKTKAKVMHVMEWYLLSKLCEQRIRIREVEKMKYEKMIDVYKMELAEKEKKIMTEMEENLQKVLADEKEKEKLLTSRLVNEEVFLTADTTETEMKDKYEKFLLQLNISDLMESYQLEMDEYSKFWKKKAIELEINTEEEEKKNKENEHFYEMHAILDEISKAEMKCKQKAKEELEESIRKVKGNLTIIPQREKKLKILRKRNEELMNKIGHWNKIIPDVVDEMEKFVKFSFPEVPEKTNLLHNIRLLREFEETKPKVIDIAELEISLSEDSSTVTVPKSVSEETKDSPPEKASFYLDLTNRFLSDGDLNHEGQVLLELKFIICDLLRMIIPSETSVLTIQQEYYNDPCKSSDSTSTPKHAAEDHLSKLPSNAGIISRLSQIAEIIDETLKIVGENFSNIDFGNPGKFMSKRTLSISQILKESE